MNKDTRWFRLDLNPEPWAVGPLSVIRRDKKVIPTMGRNQELWTYQQAVKSELEGKPGVEMMTGPLRVYMFFWRQIEQYTTHQGKASRNHEADVTNLQKALEDALHGLFYKNDKDNIWITSCLVRQDPDTEPHIILGIEEIGWDVPYELLMGVPEDIKNVGLTEDKIALLSDEEKRWIEAKNSDDF